MIREFILNNRRWREDKRQLTKDDERVKVKAWDRFVAFVTTLATNSLKTTTWKLFRIQRAQWEKPKLTLNATMRLECQWRIPQIINYCTQLVNARQFSFRTMARKGSQTIVWRTVRQTKRCFIMTLKQIENALAGDLACKHFRLPHSSWTQSSVNISQ